ncbi:MAG: hypothetical protein IPN97_12785 [Saprospiraceae bacterium]|nr:hypothetical protein [Saprospiraceae bacterium]
MTPTILYIVTIIVSVFGSYFLIKSNITKLNKENLENYIIGYRVGNILVIFTFICIIYTFISFGWKAGLITFILWFVSGALTGLVLKR